MKRPALLVCVGAVLLSVGWIWGRLTAPTRTVEKVKTVEVVKEVAAKSTEETHDRALALDTRASTRVRERLVRRPDGTVERTVTRDVAAASSTRAAEGSTKREVEVRYVDRWRVEEKVKTVEASAPAWGVAAGAGFQRGHGPVYRGEVERQIVGPIYAGIYASTAWEAGALVRVRF